ESLHIELFSVCPFPRLSCRLSALLCFSFCSPCHHRDLPSFPTRRSSDLFGTVAQGVGAPGDHGMGGGPVDPVHEQAGVNWTSSRSEEHTSELQSRFDLVCRLLLEKKKKIVVKERSLTLYSNLRWVTYRPC